MKTYPFYITLQACVAITFIFVIIMTVRYSSSSIAFFEMKPESAVAKITSLFDGQQAAIINPQSERLKKQSSLSSDGKDKQSHKPFDYILENQRIRIATEMDQFPFENSHQQLLDLIPESGGQPKRAMIATTWRSGSTFLGDILLSHPATFYHYEPLINYQIHQIRDGFLASKAVQVIESIFNCDYSNLGNFFDYARRHLEALSHNERLWSHCYGLNRQHCYNQEFLSQFCSLFPFQSLKTVRLRLNLTRSLIENLNVQVLLLVRDPRGTLQSRKHRKWCPGQADCDEPERLCSDLVDDYYAAKELMAKYPERIRVIRYEDFCEDIRSNARSLLHFFGFQMHPRVVNFIESHTHSDKGGVSSTFRDSKNAPYHWRHELSLEEVLDIQHKCDKALRLWGYKTANTPKELENLQPLLKYHF